MEARAPHEVVAAVRSRVGQAAGTWLAPSECLQASLAASLRDADAVLSFLFCRGVATSILENREKIKLSVQEFEVLYGCHAPARIAAAFSPLQCSVKFQSQVSGLQAALRCTVGEASQNSAWSRISTRAAALLAMYLDSAHEVPLSVALGGVVSADARRVEDFRVETEDAQLDVLLLADIVSCLAASVL